jgi:hypothetical protein
MSCASCVNPKVESVPNPYACQTEVKLAFVYAVSSQIVSFPDKDKHRNKSYSNCFDTQANNTFLTFCAIVCQSKFIAAYS